MARKVQNALEKGKKGIFVITRADDSSLIYTASGVCEKIFFLRMCINGKLATEENFNASFVGRVHHKESKEFFLVTDLSQNPIPYGYSSLERKAFFLIAVAQGPNSTPPITIVSISKPSGEWGISRVSSFEHAKTIMLFFPGGETAYKNLQDAYGAKKPILLTDTTLDRSFQLIEMEEKSDVEESIDEPNNDGFGEDFMEFKNDETF